MTKFNVNKKLKLAPIPETEREYTDILCIPDSLQNKDPWHDVRKIVGKKERMMINKSKKLKKRKIAAQKNEKMNYKNNKVHLRN